MGDYLGFFADNIILILVIAAILIAVGGFLLYRYNYYPRLMDRWKPYAARHYDVVLAGEDRSLRERKFVIGRYSIYEPELRRAYYLVHNLQLRKKGSNRKVLVVCERNARPVDFLNTMSDEDWKKLPTAKRVFLSTTNDINATAAKTGGESGSTMLQIGILILTLMVVIAGAAKMAG